FERAARELQWLFCAPRRASASVLAPDELDEAAALAAGRRALGELHELARIDPTLAPGDASELARTLEQVELVSGRGPLSGAVARAEELLILSWHVADDEGAASSRSLFVDDICDLFDPSLSDRRARRPLGAVDDVHARQQPALTAGAGASEPLREPRVLAELRDHVWSASSLERWV